MTVIYRSRPRCPFAVILRSAGRCACAGRRRRPSRRISRRLSHAPERSCAAPGPAGRRPWRSAG